MELADNADKLYFRDLAKMYLQHQSSRIKKSSLYDVEGKVKKHLISYFGDTEVSKIKPLDILKWQTTLDEYSFAHKEGLRGLLGSVFRFGERYYDIKNIMIKVEPLRNPEIKQELHFWTPEQFQEFIAQVEDIRYNTFFRMLYMLGMRKGEGLALSWADIDLKKGIININKSITRKVKGVPYEVTTPKNKTSIRKVNMPKNLIEAFTEYKSWQKQNCDSTEFVFCGDRPFAERTIDRVFAQATQDAKLPKIKIHDLRHTCASLLLANGIPMKQIQEWLGHSDFSTTANIYAHLEYDTKLQSAEMMAKVIGNED